jgi:hypothetical protein
MLNANLNARIYESRPGVYHERLVGYGPPRQHRPFNEPYRPPHNYARPNHTADRAIFPFDDLNLNRGPQRELAAPLRDVGPGPRITPPGARRLDSLLYAGGDLLLDTQVDDTTLELLLEEEEAEMGMMGGTGTRNRTRTRARAPARRKTKVSKKPTRRPLPRFGAVESSSSSSEEEGSSASLSDKSDDTVMRARSRSQSQSPVLADLGNMRLV